MASSYGYSDTYYDVYYNFVVDSDAFNAAVDTGTVNAVQNKSSSDAFSATVDAASPAAASLSSADTRPAASETGSVAASGFIFSNDSYAGNEGTPLVRLRDGDISNNYETDFVADTDFAAGSDAAQSPQVLAAGDAFAGAEAFGPLHLAGPGDVFLAFDQAQAFPVGLADNDPGTFSEANGFLPAFPFSSADTFSGADSTGVALPDIFGNDAGSFADAQVLVARPADADVLSLADAGIATVPMASSDTGSGADAAVPDVVGADSGGVNPVTGEAFSLDVLSGDSCSGEEKEGFPDNPFSHELGKFAEAGTVRATFSSPDAIHSSETAGYDPASLLYGMLEGFSISRAAILTASTGLETARLYGVRSASISPQVSTAVSAADDSVLLTWNDIATVEISVEGGFIPFSALNTIMGWNTVSSGTPPHDSYALSLYRQFVPSAAPFSLVFRCDGKDYRGRPRTLDLLLYTVTFQSLEFTSVYKTGLGATFTARADISDSDEAGNPLADLEYGRLIESPGQLTGAITSLFGAGIS